MTEPVQPDAMRVSDVGRKAVQERLRHAHEVGEIDLSEFDERVAAVWASRTRADLARTTADLPPLPRRPAPPRTRNHGAVFADSGGGTAMRVLTIIWACISSVNLIAWGLASLANGDVLYPWWLWAAGPLGSVLLVLYVAGAGRPPRLEG